MGKRRSGGFGATIGKVLPVLASLFAGPLVHAQNHSCPTEAPSQERIDRAVSKGVEFLRTETRKSALTMDGHGGHTLDELVLAAMVYGGLAEEHADVQWLLKRVLERPFRKTYEAVLLAVALDKLDREFYLWKLIECAYFLAANQCENGQWTYSDEVEQPGWLKKLVAEAKGWGAARRKSRKSESGTKPKGPRIELQEIQDRPRWAEGDNSNTQFAALGLRICSDAGILFSKKTLERARDWWLAEQGKEGGWTYSDRSRARQTRQVLDDMPTMTAGGVSSLVILQDLLQRRLPKGREEGKAGVVAKAVEKGAKWLSEHWTFRPLPAVVMRHVYIHYSLERVGILTGQEKIGVHPWYWEGALDLLTEQGRDGSWRMNLPRGAANQPKEDLERTWALVDTAIAVLFFRKSVRPMVPTGH